MSPFVSDPERPLVTAVMLAGRLPQWQIQLAVNCFANQTYANRELVVVNNAKRQFAASGLELVWPRSPDGKPMGSIVDLDGLHSAGMCRNYGVSAAAGDVIIHFDSHCWHHPSRIGEQVEALLKHDAAACMLKSGLEYSYSSGWLGEWEVPKGYLINTLAFRKTDGLDYLDVDKCEELSLLSGLQSRATKIISVDRPGLICRMHYEAAADAVRASTPMPGVDSKLASYMSKVVKSQALD